MGLWRLSFGCSIEASVKRHQGSEQRIPDLPTSKARHVGDRSSCRGHRTPGWSLLVRRCGTVDAAPGPLARTSAVEPADFMLGRRATYVLGAPAVSTVHRTPRPPAV